MIWLRSYASLHTLFHAAGLFLYPLKTLENQRFSDVSRGYKKWLAEWNGLTSSCIFTYLSAHKIITCSLYYRLAWLVVDLNVNYFHSLISGSFLQEPMSESTLIHIWRPRFGGKAKMRCYWTLLAPSKCSGRPIFIFVIKENWICIMSRHQTEPNINILFTISLPFDSNVRQWSHPLIIPLHCLWAKSNNGTRAQFECYVT